MPEGHTIHRLARDLEVDLAGERVGASSPQGRFLDAEALDQTKLLRTEAVGKHLLLFFAGRRVVHIHLGLFGRFRRQRSHDEAPRPTIRLRLIGPTVTWDLSGPTCCELVSPPRLRALRERLGADPLAGEADVEKAFARVQKTDRAIGAVLLDQRILAGIGNVYRAELLFLAGVHPDTPASSLDRATFDAIWRSARELLARGVKDRRIITVPSSGKGRPKRSEALWVYRRALCRRCGGAIARFSNGGRPIYACAVCQPPLEPLAEPRSVRGSRRVRSA